MPINYALFENNLTSDPNDYAAQVQTTASADLDAIVRRIIDQGSTSTEADIATVLEDASRHRIDVGANPGSRIRKTVRNNAQAVKVESVKPAPSPLEYSDLGSGEINGHRLKYNLAEADEGIFFIPAGGGAEAKMNVVQENKPSRLVFLSPAAAPASDYYLEVRARMSNGKELRTGRLDATLTV